jgi:hypothetical protein
MDHANDTARVITGAMQQREVGDSLMETLADRHTRGALRRLLPCRRDREPLATQSLEHEDTEHGGRRLVRAYEVRAAKLGDGLAVGWRDVTGHVLAEAELERRNRELTLVGEMVEYLQAVESSDEVFNIAASFGSRLFGDFSGGLFLQNESGSVVEAMASWGDPTWGERVRTEDCWALRRGQRHGVSRATPPAMRACCGWREALLYPADRSGAGDRPPRPRRLRDGQPLQHAALERGEEALAVSVGEHLGSPSHA